MALHVRTSVSGPVCMYVLESCLGTRVNGMIPVLFIRVQNSPARKQSIWCIFSGTYYVPPCAGISKEGTVSLCVMASQPADVVFGSGIFMIIDGTAEPYPRN